MENKHLLHWVTARGNKLGHLYRERSEGQRNIDKSVKPTLIFLHRVTRQDSDPGWFDLDLGIFWLVVGGCKNHSPSRLVEYPDLMSTTNGSPYSSPSLLLLRRRRCIYCRNFPFSSLLSSIKRPFQSNCVTRVVCSTNPLNAHCGLRFWAGTARMAEQYSSIARQHLDICTKPKTRIYH